MTLYLSKQAGAYAVAQMTAAEWQAVLTASARMPELGDLRRRLGPLADRVPADAHVRVFISEHELRLIRYYLGEPL